MPPKKQEEEAPAEATEAEQGSSARIPMQHETDDRDSLLSIGDAVYEVTAGTVLVAAEHVAAALIAGFRIVG